jgi:hypothetical protein
LSRRGDDAVVGRGTVISIGEEVQPARPARLTGLPAARVWTAVVAAALVTAALWLRTPDVRYLAPAAVATVLGAILLKRVPRTMRAWGAATALALAAFSAMGAIAQRDLTRIARDWSTYRSGRIARGAQRLDVTLDSIEAALTQRARTALESPADTM